MLYVFDWDGTLCNSLEKIVSCLRKAAELAGEPELCPDRARQIIGLALPEAIETLFPNTSGHLRDAIADHYRSVFISDQTPTQLFAEAIETLNGLKQRGHRLAVATGKSRRGLDKNLNDTGLDGFFCATRCADETVSKPDPTMLFQLLEELETEPQQAVMIGDTTFDLAMAEAAGMERIGVSFGSHSVQQLQAHNPALIIDDLRELLSWQST